jgi:hypothetical protein
MLRPQPQDGAGWATFPELEPTQGHFVSLRATGVTRHTIVPAAARPVFRILSTGKNPSEPRHRQIAIWSVRIVTPCRGIIFTLRAVSGLRTSEAVTCPMIMQLDARPRG